MSKIQFDSPKGQLVSVLWLLAPGFGQICVNDTVLFKIVLFENYTFEMFSTSARGSRLSG